MTAQRNSGGPCQCRDIYYPSRLIPCCIEQGIAQCKPSLCICADNLYSPSAHGTEYITGAYGAPARHIFHRRKQPYDIQRQPEHGCSPEYSNRCRAAGHIKLHLAHPFARLNRNTAAVTSNGLADNNNRLSALFTAVIFEDDKPWRLLTCLS